MTLRRRTPLRSRPASDCEACARYGRTLCTHRTRLDTRAHMERRAEMRRRARLPKRNRERRDKLWREHFGSEERVEWVTGHACEVPGCWTRPTEAAHAKSRGSGGTADDLLSLCYEHHAEQHTIGVRTFEAKHGISLELIAARYAREWNERRAA